MSESFSLGRLQVNNPLILTCLSLACVIQIIRDAVSGMLPKNKLRDRRLERLKIFVDEEHPYAANISRRYDVVEPQVQVRGKAAGPNEA